MRIRSRCVAVVAAAAVLSLASACDNAGPRSEPVVAAKDSRRVAAPHVTDGAVGRATGGLEGGSTSPRQLVERVLDALAMRDTTVLVDMLVDAGEYERIVYPELGAHYVAARDTRAETRRFLWENQRLDALKGMRSALRELGGRRLAFLTIEFVDGEKRFPSYRLLEGPVVSVADADGSSATLHLLGTIIESDGHYKLLSYRDLD